jgi:hypothetical protein
MIKKSYCLWLVIIFLWGGSLFGWQEEEILQETVRVVNVEVPVRVHYRGKPVDNLTKNDFKLFEKGKQQDIHGFILKRKKINVQELKLNAEQVMTRKQRFFVLVFRFTHYNDDIKKGLDYIFDTILTDTDQLLVFANDRSAYFEFLNDKPSVKTKVAKILHDVSRKARTRLLMHLKKVEREVEKHKFELKLINAERGSMDLHFMIYNYLEKFLNIWRNYKKKYLIPDINKYYNFAQFLKKIKKEKWVIDFYQFEVFPDILINSESMRRIRRLIGAWQASDNPELITFSRLIFRRLTEIEMELSVAKDFPSDEVAKIFHNVDTTFHSVFMKTTFSTLLQDAEYREVASELENSLRAITKRTGGKLVVSNKLDKALDRISKVEDIYYILTYAPANPDKVGRIKVKLKNPKYKLIYSPNLRTGYLGQYLEEKQPRRKPINIEDLRLKKGRLMFNVSDFYMDKEDGGILRIHIRIEDQQGKSVFDQKKIIKATRKSIQINIDLNIKDPKNGEYNIVVDITDLYTTIRDTQFLKTTISN